MSLMTAFSLRDLEDSPDQKTVAVTPAPSEISSCRNAIEPLVTEEVERQLKHLPPQMVKYINPVQVLAYALNRLPALYATSEEGWHRQQLRARQHLRDQISMAVRQGFAAVQKDPLKVATPLKHLTEEGARS
jgi:Late competence development protein ComFB